MKIGFEVSYDRLYGAPATTILPGFLLLIFRRLALSVVRYFYACFAYLFPASKSAVAKGIPGF